MLRKSGLMLVMVSLALLLNACGLLNAAITGVSIEKPLTIKRGQSIIIGGFVIWENSLLPKSGKLVWNITKGPGTLEDPDPFSLKDVRYTAPAQTTDSSVTIRAHADRDPSKFDETTIPIVP